MTLQDIITKTQELLRVPSVIRFESPFIDRLAEEFSFPDYVVDRQDKLLVVSKKGSNSSRVITAHLDRHGIVINKEGNFEYAAFNAKKQYDLPVNDAESLFKKIGHRFVNEQVFAYDAKTGCQIEAGVVRNFSYDFQKKNLFFEIEGMHLLEPETPVAFVSSMEQKNGFLSSQIDNAISIAVAYQLVKEGFDGQLFFGAEEEIGKSWNYIIRYMVSHGIKSDKLLVLDTTPYESSDVLEKGLVVLRNKDEHGAFNKAFVARIRSLCDVSNIPYEIKDKVIEEQNARLQIGEKPKKLGSTELGRIIEHGDKMYDGTTLQIPTIKYHTNHETTSELALSNYYALLRKML